MSSCILRAACEAVAIIVLLAMLVQDWRWYGIQWPLFPLLAILLLGSHLTMASLPVVLFEAAVNFVLVGIQLLALTLYVRLRFRSSLWHYLGIGDLLYWLACCLYFSPVVFILYHLISLVVALGIYLLARNFSLSSKPLERIPLAGFQAANLAFIILLFWVLPAFRPSSDDAVLSYFG